MNAQLLVKFQNQIESVLRPIFSLANGKIHDLGNKAKAALELEVLLSSEVKATVEDLNVLGEELHEHKVAFSAEESALIKRQHEEIEALQNRHTKENVALKEKKSKAGNLITVKIEKAQEKLRLLGVTLGRDSWRENICHWRLDLMRKGYFSGYVPVWYVLGKRIPADSNDAASIFENTTVSLTSHKSNELAITAREKVKDLYSPLTEAAEALKESMIMAWTAEDTDALKGSIRDINAKKRALLKLCATAHEIADVAADCPTSSTK